MISSWEQLNAGRRVGATELEVPTLKDGGGRGKSQEFRDLCQMFDGRKEEGVEEDVSLKQARIPDCSFAKVASTLPGPNVGRGARRKLFGQTKLSFEVMKGGSLLVSTLTNKKRGLETDSVEKVLAKRVKV